MLKGSAKLHYTSEVRKLPKSFCSVCQQLRPRLPASVCDYMRLPKRTFLAALAISTAAGFLLCGYEFIRAVSTSLFLDAYGAQNLPRVMLAVLPGTFLLLYVYGRILSWLGATRTLLLTSLSSAALIASSYGMFLKGYTLAAAFVYVFREAYIVLIIEQYWSLVNSTLTTEQARRINGPFCGIASLGAITGGLLVRVLATRLGSEHLLLFAAGSLLPAAACSAMAYALAGEPKPSKSEEGGKEGHTGLQVFFQSRYLIFIGLLILTTQVVSTMLDLRFNGLVEIEKTNTDERTSFYGSFYAGLNAVALLLQFIAVPLMLRLISLRIIHLGIPVIHLVTCVILTIAPSLWSGLIAYLLFKSFDYSIFRAGKEIFYIPLSFDARYRAKQVIDTFVYRFAKGGSAGIIALVGLIVKVPGIAFSITPLVMTAIWSVLVSTLTTQYQNLKPNDDNGE